MTGISSPAALAEHVGSELGTSDWLLIDQARINGFADHTGDHQWIHVDVERATQGPFGAPVAHGFLTLWLAPVFLSQVVEVDGVRAAVNHGVNRVRFPAPVLVDRRVRGHVRLVTATEREAGVEAVYGITVEIEGESRPALVAELVVLYS